MPLTSNQKKGIAYVVAGALIVGGGIWAIVYFSKDEEERSGSGSVAGSSSSTGAGQGKCPAGETYNAVTKKCCHPTIARVGCPRAGQGKGTVADVLAERG